MLLRTPELNCPTETIAGSWVMSTLRLTIVCSAVTICAPTTIGIDAAPRGGAVRLLALDDDLEVIGGGHERTAAVGDGAGRHVGEHVQAEDGVDLRVLHHPFLDHQLARPPAARRAARPPRPAGR